MAKEIAIGKRAKITEAQKYMMLSVGAASIILGVAASLTVRFIQQISFNSEVIAAEEESIVAYSDVIKSIGVCESPSGTIYTEGELDACHPDSIETVSIPNTLRANVMDKLAANEALNSVPNESSSICVDPTSGKNYTYDDLKDNLDDAKRDGDAAEIAAANQLMKSCSALRVIPDALPSYKNEEALLASVNKLFIDANWQPESLSPGSAAASTTDTTVSLPEGVNALPVNLSVEASTDVTTKVLNNIERSIREFDISKATIKWEGVNRLSLNAQATAYYIDKATLTEEDKVLSPGGK